MARSEMQLLRTFVMGVALAAWLADPIAAQLSPRHVRYWHDGPPFEIFGIPAAGDANGYRIAIGHFNDQFREGAADIAFTDGENLPWELGGAVHAVYNENIDPQPTFTQFLHDILPNGPSPIGDRELGDQFGRGIAVGDFNWDGWDDLAIGVPGETVDGHVEAGAVLVLYGGITGLRTSVAQRFVQGPLYGETPEAGDHFGWALAAADFNADGIDDLLVAAPDETYLGVAQAGVVQLLLGGANGLVSGGLTFSQGPCCLPSIGDTREPGDRFGWTLAAGDFNSDGAGDVAIGVPFEDLEVLGGALENAGMVHVVYGYNGANPRDPQTFTQFNDGTQVVPWEHARYGEALLGADLTFDGDSELVIGAPGATVFTPEPQAHAGSVTILMGGSGGLVSQGAQYLTQSTLGGTPDPSEAGDLFGTSLAAGRFDGDGQLDLAIGAPGEDYTVPPVSYDHAGQVTILFSEPVFGVTPSSERQVLRAPADTVISFGNYGFSLGAGDFDADGLDDLAVGAPGNALGETPNVGGLYAYRNNNVFSDGFESGATDRWSAAVPEEPVRSPDESVLSRGCEPCAGP